MLEVGYAGGVAGDPTGKGYEQTIVNGDENEEEYDRDDGEGSRGYVEVFGYPCVRPWL